MRRAPQLRESRPSILIVGGGFAGVYTAYELSRRLKQRKPMIDIVNRENFFVFYPLIPEIVSGAIDTEHILTPIRQVVPGATLFTGEVTGIDLQQAQVEVRHGLYGQTQQVCRHSYDHLVLALGGVPNTSRIPGLSEFAYDVQRLARAFALRNHLIDVLEQANIETRPDIRKRLLTFVVIGGGTNGAEVVAEIRDLIHAAVTQYRYLDSQEFRVVLVHGGDRILPDMPEGSAGYASKLLRERGVEVLLNRRVTAVEPDRVHLNDGSVIATETVVGSVGVQPNSLVRDLAVPHDRQGRVIVNETLNIPGFPNVWAVGDNAAVIDPHTRQPYPQSAQHAVREARVVAANIAASLQGKRLRPITYKTRGQLVALGHRSAVANVRGHAFSGFLAWWLWRTYYLAQLPHWEKRLRVTADWTLDLLFPRSLVQLKVGQTSAVSPHPGETRGVATAASAPHDSSEVVLSEGTGSLLAGGSLVSGAVERTDQFVPA